MAAHTRARCRRQQAGGLLRFSASLARTGHLYVTSWRSSACW